MVFGAGCGLPDAEALELEYLARLLRAAVDRRAGHSAGDDVHHVVILEIIQMRSNRRRGQPPDWHASRLHLTEESKLEFSRDAGCATVRHAPGNNHRCHAGGSGSLAVDHANNVTQVLGIRAFGSQLLCEQVVGRGLRRIDYTPDPTTGLLTEEYADVYGIPFSVIPFKGRPVKKAEPDDRPKNHVRALPGRALMAIRFPVVEGYVFAL